MNELICEMCGSNNVIKDEGLFVLGLLSSNLEQLAIETAIEKDQNPEQQNKNR